MSPSDIRLNLVDEYIEPKQGWNGKATALIGFPSYVDDEAILQENWKDIERLEWFIGWVELWNGYTIQVESAHRKRRYDQATKGRIDKGLQSYKYDYELLTMMKGIPQHSTMSIGLDRLMMFIFGNRSIFDHQMFIITD